LATPFLTGYTHFGIQIHHRALDLSRIANKLNLYVSCSGLAQITVTSDESLYRFPNSQETAFSGRHFQILRITVTLILNYLSDFNPHLFAGAIRDLQNRIVVVLKRPGKIALVFVLSQ
jgi:hypothetical protein